MGGTGRWGLGRLKVHWNNRKLYAQISQYTVHRNNHFSFVPVMNFLYTSIHDLCFIHNISIITANHYNHKTALVKGSFPSHNSPRGGADLWFCSKSCKSMVTGPVHRVECQFSSQLAPVPIYTASWQRQHGVRNLSKVFSCTAVLRLMGLELASTWTLVQHPTGYATATPLQTWRPNWGVFGKWSHFLSWYKGWWRRPCLQIA